MRCQKIGLTLPAAGAFGRNIKAGSTHAGGTPGSEPENLLAWCLWEVYGALICLVELRYLVSTEGG